MSIPKFDGEILDIGNDYFLVKKSVVYDWSSQMKKLKKDVQEMQVKPVKKKTGVVAGKEGRNEVLNSEQKEQVLELRKRGYSLRQIAEVFGVSHETIRQVKSESEMVRKSGSVFAALTEEQKRLIGEQRREGWSVFQCYESLRDMGYDVGLTEVDEVYNSAETAQNAPQGAQKASMPQSAIFGQKSNVGDSGASQGVKDLFDGVNAGEQTNLMGDFDSAKAKLNMRRISADPFARD